MAVPDYQTLMLPVLRVGASGETSVRDCVKRLAEEFQLSEEDSSKLLPSGKQTVFSNRVHWAKTYLVKAELLEITVRAHFRATARGQNVLAKQPQRIDNDFLSQFEEFREFRAKRSPPQSEGAATIPMQTGTATPEEQIATATEEIDAELRTQLLDRIVSAEPIFFEKVVVDLMTAMGYGGTRGAAQRVGRSGDGGIDGVINEDALGLDVVYLQAKRYAPSNGIGVEKVREFVGSLVGRGATKGVFVTTSYFAPGAKKFVDRVPQRLVLIDGEELTRLLIRYGVGVRTITTIELKKLDLAYFDEEDA